MKALLVSMGGAPVTPSYFMPDNGLAGLAACLLEEGHDVEVIDLNTVETMDRLFPKELKGEAKTLVQQRKERRVLNDRDIEQYGAFERKLEHHRTNEFDKMGNELARHAAKVGAELVGFKLWSGDGWTGSLQMAKAVRGAMGDKVLIIGGGSQVDFYSDVLFSQAEGGIFDALSIAEGEPTIVALAEHIEHGLAIEQVPNLLLPGNPVIRTAIKRIESLDTLPRPCYDEAVYPQTGRLRVATFEETRGCPHKCAFCAHPLKAGSNRRDCPPERVVEDMQWLQQEHGFRGFKLGGSYTPSEYLRQLANRIIDQQVRIPFCSYGRISDAKEADFELYHRAGCEALFFGLESGSQIILNRTIKKGHKVSDSIRVLKSARAAGIYVLASTIFPNPGENEETRRATLETIEEINPNAVPLMYPVPLPHSKWFAEPDKYGFQIDDPEQLKKELVGYKVRVVLPFSYWDSLSFKIDHKPFGQFAKETEAFAEDIRKRGPLVPNSDEIVLFARLAGCSSSSLLDQMRDAMLTGDIAATASIISRVNRGQ